MWIYLVSGAAIKTAIIVFGVLLVVLLAYITVRLMCIASKIRGDKSFLGENESEYQADYDDKDAKIYLDATEQDKIQPMIGETPFQQV